MNKDIKLGIEIQKLKESYSFKELVKFLKGEETNCYNFDRLKPLYDVFGYAEVNTTILEVADEDKPNE